MNISFFGTMEELEYFSIDSPIEDHPGLTNINEITEILDISLEEAKEYLLENNIPRIWCSGIWKYDLFFHLSALKDRKG